MIAQKAIIICSLLKSRKHLRILPSLRQWGVWLGVVLGSMSWLALKELHLSYHNGDIKQRIWSVNCGNLL